VLQSLFKEYLLKVLYHKRLIKVVILSVLSAILAGFVYLFFIDSKPSTSIDSMELLSHYDETRIQKVRDEFDTWTTCLIPDILIASPLSASFKYGDLNALGLNDLSSKLDDFSPVFFNGELEKAKQNLQKLESIEYALLDQEQKKTYEMLYFQYELLMDGAPYLYYAHMIEPSSGIQMHLPISLIQIEFKTTDEIDAYISRLQEIPRLFDQLIEYELVKAERGLLMPESLYDLVLQQLDQLLVEPEKFMIYVAFEDHIDQIADLDPQLKEAYKFKCLTIIEDQIYPAYGRLIETLQDVKSLGTSNTGVCAHPNGKEYYEYIIKRETSYDMSAEALRGWVTEELYATIATIQQLYTDYPELQTCESYNDLLPTFQDLNALYHLEEKCLKDQFYDYDIKRASEDIIPPYLEQYVASGFYFPIAIDGSKYGTMYLQENAYAHINTTTLELYFHENIPGHHLYFSRFYLSDAPMIRKMISWLPYEEGWAQYIQGVSIDYYGLNKPLTQLIKATSKLSYYYMLLVDIQYHYDGISIEEANRAFIDLGFPEASAKKIVNRMAAHPGEIIHYIYGAYKIESYLSKCQTALAEDFNIKDFHEMILINAGLPFTTMDRIVLDYIKEMQNP
jgi:uncharacterized protein (DUF885 family)